NDIGLKRGFFKGAPGNIARRTLKKAPLQANVIQIRMTERELELRNVPVSFFIKKIYKKFQERG
ncbi:MAG: hypothetical protein IJP90_06700, partial [Treponema sp.]|nr:hypothetical protein [Treponema sp.]